MPSYRPSSDEFRKAGKELPLRDLYAMNFSPVLAAADFSAIQNGSVCDDVRAEQEQIRAADVLIVVYPLWWSGMPAMLKGYIDRVFSYGLPMRSTRPVCWPARRQKRSFSSRPQERHGRL